MIRVKMVREDPATGVSYQLSRAGAVRLDVFALLGRRIATLTDEVQPAGKHAVRFDASALPSGLYDYRLSSGQSS